MSHIQLTQYPIDQLKGVGPKLKERLTKLHIHTVQDALFHLPLRYEDRTRITPIHLLQPHLHLAVAGEIEACNIQFGKRRSLMCVINDGTGRITLRFFNFSAAQKNAMQVGMQMRAFGEIRRWRAGLEIIHPDYSVSEQGTVLDVNDTLTAVYPTTEGLKQLSLRNIIDGAIDLLERHDIEELLPKAFQTGGLSLKAALLTLHRPAPDVSMALLEEGEHPAQLRLIQEELLAHSLSLLKLRQSAQAHHAVPLKANHTLSRDFLAQLPFSPTQAQARVVSEIHHDLAKPLPMLRLVQGDVGSGKTLVAALSALCAIENGYQVALMAPTEILAEQHANAFANWFTPLGIQVAWLSGKTKGKQREAALSQIESGEAQMVVGTHALFQAKVAFQNLALIIIDEQHRFGVHQRLALREKGKNGDSYPHQLVMTATPIPRTLAMTAYADLEVSIIDELPPGRTPISTVAVPDTRRDDVIARVAKAVADDKRQVYWVCTLIEESDALQCQAAEDAQAYLQSMLPDCRIGLVHGRMKPDEKQTEMARFKNAELDVLVATTVIEVGVDVPNASLIIIENPERLGLAQLHQLRGRVGRGAVASHCVLLYKSPLSVTSQKRLGVLRDSTDGFVIAERDLEIRGPGEVLGTKQTGMAEFKIADLNRDRTTVLQTRPMAQKLLAEHPDLADKLIARWLPERSHFAQA